MLQAFDIALTDIFHLLPVDQLQAFFSIKWSSFQQHFPLQTPTYSGAYSLQTIPIQAAYQLHIVILNATVRSWQFDWIRATNLSPSSSAQQIAISMIQWALMIRWTDSNVRTIICSATLLNASTWSIRAGSSNAGHLAPGEQSANVLRPYTKSSYDNLRAQCTVLCKNPT